LAAQAVHEVEPSANVVVPTGQVAQLVEFAVEENVFAAQGVHEDALDIDKKKPARQTVTWIEICESIVTSQVRPTPASGADKHVICVCGTVMAQDVALKYAPAIL